MFVEILEKSPNFEDRGGESSPPLYIKIFIFLLTMRWLLFTFLESCLIWSGTWAIL